LIEWISTWAGGIVLSVIIATILEMILPEGNNKKYIKVVIGVYILFAIISPIITKVSGKELNIKDELAVDKFWGSNDSIQTIHIDTDSSIGNIYITNLKSDIKEKLKQQGYIANKIDLEVELEKEADYGKIYSISLQVDKIESTKDENENEADNKSAQVNMVETIKEVNIAVSDTKEEIQETSQKSSISQADKNKIKEYISSVYDIRKDKISINETSKV
jgi:stage III sporulation protein AF